MEGLLNQDVACAWGLVWVRVKRFLECRAQALFAGS